MMTSFDDKLAAAAAIASERNPQATAIVRHGLTAIRNLFRDVPGFERDRNAFDEDLARMAESSAAMIRSTLPPETPAQS